MCRRHRSANASVRDIDDVWLLGSLSDDFAEQPICMCIGFIAFPGTPFSSSHHFAAFMRGDRPLTSRLLKPILLDATTAEVADTRDLPFYLKALFVSQPLHFGDYGRMPLKIIWALLD